MPKTSRGTMLHPISLREVTVVKVVQLTPGMRRITLAGSQLGEFTSITGWDQPAFRSDGFDDEIRIVFPHPGQREPLLPEQIDGSVRPPEGGRVLSRGYTVRRWDPVAGELDVDIVRHATGVGTTWASRAVPGERVHFFGPLVSRSMPRDADWLLVAGDETALPAIGRLLEELPESGRARVFIEIAAESHRQPLPELPGVEVTWLLRDRDAMGGTNLLLEAVRSSVWPDGRVFAWIAGEQAVVRDLRRHLVAERGLPKTEIDFTGYWKRSAVVPYSDDQELPDLEQSPDAEERFHELTELLPPVAIRAAVQLRLGELIAQGISTPDALAAATRSDERALGKLLRYLQAIDLVSASTAGHYSLTEVGEYLADDYWNRVLHPDSVMSRSHAGVLGLAESVRTGGPAYASVTGQSFAMLRREQWFEDSFLDDAAEAASMQAEAIATSAALDGVEHLVVHSDGASTLAREIIEARGSLRVTICALPSQADWFRRDLTISIADPDQRSRVAVVERSVFQPGPEADAVLLVNALPPHPDADAAHVLRCVTASLPPDGRLLLLERTFAEQLDEHDAEADLIGLTRDGTGLRTEAELRAVTDGAGFRPVAVHRIGWGSSLHQLAHPIDGGHALSASQEEGTNR